MAETGVNLEMPVSVGDAARPIPPRYWWLKRCAVTAGLMLVLVGVSRWCWGIYATRMLQAEIDRLKAAGEPLEPEDFDLPPVADELNAAIPLREAVAIVQSHWAVWSRMDRRRRPASAPAPTPEELREAQARAADYARICALVHQARLRPAVNWGITTRSPQLVCDDVLAQEWIIRCLRDAVVAAHQRGDDAAALDIVEDTLVLANRLSAMRFLLTGMQSEITVGGIVHDLQPILAEHLPESPAQLPPGVQPLNQERIRTLRDLLLDERKQVEGNIWGVQRERLAQLDEIRSVTSDYAGQVTGRSGPWEYGRFGLWLVQPMLQLDGLRGLRTINRRLDVIKTTNLPDAVRRDASPPPLKAGLNAQTRVLNVCQGSDFARYQAWSLANLARRRMAATALAIHLYAQDRGRMPETLDELVPQYLPRVPENPLLAAGNPIQYRLHGEYPCLYAPDRQVTPAGYQHLADVSPRFYLRGQPPERNVTRPTKATN